MLDTSAPSSKSSETPLTAAPFDTSIFNPDENVKGKASMKSPIKETEEQQTQPVRQETILARSSRSMWRSLQMSWVSEYDLWVRFPLETGRRANGALVDGEILIAAGFGQPGFCGVLP